MDLVSVVHQVLTTVNNVKIKIHAEYVPLGIMLISMRAVLHAKLKSIIIIIHVSYVQQQWRTVNNVLILRLVLNVSPQNTL